MILFLGSHKNKKIRIALQQIVEYGETDFLSLDDWGDIVKEKVIEIFKGAGSHTIQIGNRSLAKLICENKSFIRYYNRKICCTFYKIVDDYPKKDIIKSETQSFFSPR